MGIRDWQKVIAVGILLTFVGIGLAWTAEQAAPQFQEKEGAPVVKKHKRFPWLPVILGVGAGVILVVLLTKGKKKTLTVDLRVGTTGTPAATAKYKKGSAVSYDYTPKAGFHNIQVRLDGMVVPARGTVTMDSDHTLDVSAKEQYILTINLGPGVTGTPATTAVYGKGDVVNYSYSVPPGNGSLQVSLDNLMVAASGTVLMDLDHNLTIRVYQTAPTYSEGVLTVNGIRYEMALIPSGEFQMGSEDPEAEADEQPVHTVRISKPFWFGRTEVTQALWQAVMCHNPSKFNYGPDYPVERVRWEDCQKFVQSLNQMLGSDAFRLPTEAEWEYACRAGSSGERYGEIDAVAWYARNSDGHTHPVGLKQPNAFGLYDILGNVWEWCLDMYTKYQSGYQVDPLGDKPGGMARMFRGGSWEMDEKFVRSAFREKSHPNYYYLPPFSVGFRLVRTTE